MGSIKWPQCIGAAVFIEKGKSALDTQGKMARGQERSGQMARKLRTLAGPTCWESRRDLPGVFRGSVATPWFMTSVF